jgi:serine/threonine-protein kinase RsbW
VEIRPEVKDMVHMQTLNPVPRTFHSAPFVELQQSFPSQIQAISPFVDQLMRFILDFRNGDGSEIEIETAFVKPFRMP